MSLYFLGIIPPEIIQQEVRILKEKIRLKYAARHALRLPAHTTLLPPFKLSEDNKLPMLESLSDFSENQKAFEINLHGFGSFPARVIFIIRSVTPIHRFRVDGM